MQPKKNRKIRNAPREKNCPSDETAGDSDNLEVFGGVAVSGNPVFTPLRASRMLDSGASHHIFNDLSRFVTYQVRSVPISLTGDAASMEIYGVGTARLTISIPSSKATRDILLLNVQYVPDCPANLVSSRQLHQKSAVQWDSEARILYRRRGQAREDIAIVMEHHGEFLLENCPPQGHAFPALSSEPLHSVKSLRQMW